MFMKSIIRSFVLLIAIVALATGCSNGGEDTKVTENQSYELRFSTSLSESALELPPGCGIVKFKEEVKRLSEGRITVKIFPGGQLGKSAEQLVGGLQVGSFECANLATGSWGEYTNAFLPLNMPYLFNNKDEVYEFIDGKIGEGIKNNILADTDVKLLSYLDIGFRHVTNNLRPIKTPKDMEGLKIRVMTDPMQILAMNSLGASATPLSYSELFTALQQGVVDAQENPLANIYTAKFYEVQDYLTLTGHSYQFTTILISNDFYNSLPDTDKAIIDEAAELAESYTREQLALREEELLTDLSEEMKIYQPTDEEIQQFRAKTLPVYDAIKEEIGANYYDEIMAELDAIRGK